MTTDLAIARGPDVSSRSGWWLGFDAVATGCGLLAAVSIAVTKPLHHLGQTAASLICIRLVGAMAGRLHRWSFRTTDAWRGAQLVFWMLAASAAFALSCRDLPRSVYVLEFFLSTTSMALVRFAPRLAQGCQRAMIPAEVAEVEYPRRLLNVAVALLALGLTVPAWLLIAAAIKLTSRGPVLYTQERVGLDLRGTGAVANDPRRRRDIGGRPFIIYKFRTMRVDAEAKTGAVWCQRRDPRVTPVGRFLRYSRLDELPQLINVLKGDMNIVGPRPERPSIFAELRSNLPDYPKRQRVRPGITGYAQVNLEYDASVADVAKKLTYDLEYVARQSVATDLCIMAKTIPVMLFRERMLGGKYVRAGDSFTNCASTQHSRMEKRTPEQVL